MFLKPFLNNLFKKDNNTSKKKNNDSDHNKIEDRINNNLEANVLKIKRILNDNSDVIFRKFVLEPFNETAVIIYIDGLIEARILNESILLPLMQTTYITKNYDNENIIEFVSNHLLTASEIKKINSVSKIIDAILSGETVLLINSSDCAFQINTRGWKSRSIDEPPNESVVRGPREGFVESLRFNTALLRRKIKSPSLIFENFTVGEVSKTDVCIAYMKNIVSNDLVIEMRKKINDIEIDYILESGYIEQLLVGSRTTMIPLIGNTEKPDVAAAKMLEGRIAILTDGTPFVLTAPHLFIESLQSSEDYYNKPWRGTIIRWIRIIALLLSVFLPAVYIAVLTYHLEILPTQLIITIAASRKGIPFKPTSEMLLMLLFFEVLKEAGIRMPKHIGMAVSIVGGLVLGEAAVKAGIVSNPTVMITALSGICGFIVMPQDTLVLIAKFTLAILASISGLFGVLIGSIMFLIKLTGATSFGVPYLAPIAPTLPNDLKDVFIKAPLWKMKHKPESINFSPKAQNTIQDKNKVGDQNEKQQ